ncbi:MAG: RIP metalloprotease RseP [Burkholderiaceae bacterium]
MNLLQTLLAFAVALGSLIVVHELGHYLVARCCGVKVLRFSLGMGKIVWSRRFGPDRTEWAVSILPLGGYVKMLDAREQDPATIAPQDLHREFTRQPVWRRFAIVAAGPLANFLFAILLFSGIYMAGVPEPKPLLRAVPEHTAAYDAGLRGGELVTAVNGEPVRIWSDLRWQVLQAAVAGAPARLTVERNGAPDAHQVELDTGRLDTADLEADFLAKLGIALARPKATLGHVVEGGPAMRAGLQEGDRILRIDGKPVLDGLDLIERIRDAAGRKLEIDGTRNGASFHVAVTPDTVRQNDRTIGRIQVEVPLAPETVVASESPPQALAKAARRTWDTSVLTLKMLGKMLVGQVSMKNITGPITIADYAGQTARIGAVSYIGFIAFISISLGVMNLLPIPVLDGGLLLYYSLEFLTGKPVPARLGELAQRAGVGILVTLMIVAVFNDIARLVT